MNTPKKKPWGIELVQNICERQCHRNAKYKAAPWANASIAFYISVINHQLAPTRRLNGVLSGVFSTKLASAASENRWYNIKQTAAQPDLARWRVPCRSSSFVVYYAKSECVFVCVCVFVWDCVSVYACAQILWANVYVYTHFVEGLDSIMCVRAMILPNFGADCPRAPSSIYVSTLWFSWTTPDNCQRPTPSPTWTHTHKLYRSGSYQEQCCLSGFPRSSPQKLIARTHTQLKAINNIWSQHKSQCTAFDRNPVKAPPPHRHPPTLARRFRTMKEDLCDGVYWQTHNFTLCLCFGYLLSILHRTHGVKSYFIIFYIDFPRIRVARWCFSCAVSPTVFTT